MVQSLFERHKRYEKITQTEMTRRLPVVIRVDGRNFSRVTRSLPRPFCTKLIELMSHTMLELVKQVDGAVFGYQQSDEISVILRNDQSVNTDPWFGNRVQKIVSVSSSIATYEFNKYLWGMNDAPNLEGSTLFDARAFVLPEHEAINYLILRQQDCMRNSVTAAAYAALVKKYNRRTAQQFLEGRGLTEREDLLSEECGIDFHREYPAAFRRGIASYLAPRIVETEHGQITKHRWILDPDLPRFVDDRKFVDDILFHGSDIFRPDRDLEPEI